jgi:nucleoid-associated protein YgaU
MPGLGDTLTEKKGPLPVWAWAALGTAGLAGFMVWRSKRNAAIADQASAQQGVATSSNLGTVPISNLTTAAQPMPLQMGDTFVNVTNPPDTTNVNVGGPDVTIQPPAPPKPAPPVAKPKPPVHHLLPAPKPPPPKPPAPKIYTVAAGDSLWKIAQKFYGNGALWTQIYNANKAAVGANPNLIHVGLRLVIPGK